MKCIIPILFVVAVLGWTSSVRAALIHDIQLLDGTSVGELVLSQDVCAGAVGFDVCTGLVSSLTIDVGGTIYSSQPNELFVGEPFYSHWAVNADWLLAESSFSFGDGNSLGVIINTSQFFGLNQQPGEFIFAAGSNDLAQFVGSTSYNLVPIHEVSEPPILLLFLSSGLLLFRRRKSD